MQIPRNFFAAALAGATVLTANLLLTETALAATPAPQRCDTWKMTGPFSVSARCKTDKGNRVQTAISLPACFGFSKGVIQPQRNGHFEKKCSGSGHLVGAPNPANYRAVQDVGQGPAFGPAPSVGGYKCADSHKQSTNAVHSLALSRLVVTAKGMLACP